MSNSTVTHPGEGLQSGGVFDTRALFAPVFEVLSAEKIDRLLTQIVYNVDWDSTRKVTINIIAEVTKLHANIIGYIPVAGVSVGACRVSIGVVRLSLAMASLGASRMLGIAETNTFGNLLDATNSIKDGFLEVSPLAVGAGLYLSKHTPSMSLLVSDLKVSQDKFGIISEFCKTTVEKAKKEDEDKYEHYKPWAQTLLKTTEKTYLFATEGAQCIVTCAAWGNIAMGIGGLAVAPYTGGASLPWAVTSLAKGALSLGASSLLEMATTYDLHGKVIRFFVPEKKEDSSDADFILMKLILELEKDREKFAEAYEAIEASGLNFS